MEIIPIKPKMTLATRKEVLIARHNDNLFALVENEINLKSLLELLKDEDENRQVQAKDRIDELEYAIKAQKTTLMIIQEELANEIDKEKAMKKLKD